jgi:putative endonuclease
MSHPLFPREVPVREFGGCTYILASKRNGTLYTGVTSDLLGRVWSHRQGTASIFTRRYNVTRLVWFEAHETIQGAIQRETSIKRWPRKWKLNLIEASNPQWKDLYEELTREPQRPDWAR